MGRRRLNMMFPLAGVGSWDDGPAVVGRPVQVDAAAGDDVGAEVAQVGGWELGEQGVDAGASAIG